MGTAPEITQTHRFMNNHSLYICILFQRVINSQISILIWLELFWWCTQLPYLARLINVHSCPIYLAYVYYVIELPNYHILTYLTYVSKFPTGYSYFSNWLSLPSSLYRNSLYHAVNVEPCNSDLACLLYYMYVIFMLSPLKNLFVVSDMQCIQGYTQYCFPTNLCRVYKLTVNFFYSRP